MYLFTVLKARNLKYITGPNSRCWQVRLALEALEENPFLAFQFLVVPGILWPMATFLNCYLLHMYITFSSVCLKNLSATLL